MTLSVRDVLQLGTIQSGGPEVLAGASALDNPVRWVHIADISDVAPLLKGSELLLTSGLGLSPDEKQQRRYVSELSKAGVAGVVMTLGWRFTEPPPALVAEAERRCLPLVILRKAIPFVEVTEHVHAEIISRQFVLLRKAEEIGRSFTELVLHGSGIGSLVEGLGQVVNKPVILENMAHQVVAFWDWSGHGTDETPTWEAHAREGHSKGSLPFHIEQWAPTGCAWTTIPFREEGWGRLHVLLAGSQLDEIDRLAIDRAAIAIALLLLSQRDAAQVVDQVGGDLIADILGGNVYSETDLFARARALGCNLRGRRLVALAVDADDFAGTIRRQQLDEAEIQQVKRTMLSVTRRAMEDERCIGISTVDSDEILAVVGGPEEGDLYEALDRLGRRIHELLPGRAGGLTGTVGVSRQAPTALGLAHAFEEAREAVLYGKSVRRGPGVYHFENLGVDSLILRLRDTAELSRFVESELGPLLDHDAKRSVHLMPTLQAYLDHGRNKSASARALHLERRSLYHRLDKIAKLLGRDLRDMETSTRLHVALKALAILRRGASSTGDGDGDSR
jgi:purine catabolism regulator